MKREEMSRNCPKDTQISGLGKDIFEAMGEQKEKNWALQYWGKNCVDH